VQSATLGWAGLVLIDGAFYSWLGDESAEEFGNAINNATLTDVEIMPTKTVFHINAGPMELNITFLSPIEVCAQLSRKLRLTLMTSRIISRTYLSRSLMSHLRLVLPIIKTTAYKCILT
jgi:hypothetical protein